MIAPVIASFSVQLLTGFICAFILARYVHRVPLLEWLRMKTGPPSVAEMLVTLRLFVFGVLGSIGAALLVM